METAKSCTVVTAGTVAKGLLLDVTESIDELGRPPVLVGFLATSDSGSRMYAEWTGKTCTKNGIQFELREVNREDLESSISRANSDDAVDGIMVYYPVFNGPRDQQIKAIVAPSKDVEGLNSGFIQNLYNGYSLTSLPSQRTILPTTPLAMVEILEYLKVHNHNLPHGSRLSGRSITIINRSDVVGKPLAALLAHEGACVYSVDIGGIQTFRKHQGNSMGLQILDKEMTLNDCLGFSDVVISGVPGDKFKVPLESLREGCVCLNFSSEKNFDPDVKSKASMFVPTIGPVTIAVLMRNLVYLIKNKEASSRQRQYIEQRQTHVQNPWLLRLFGSKFTLSSGRWFRPQWTEYAIYVVGVSIGLFSLLH